MFSCYFHPVLFAKLSEKITLCAYKNSTSAVSLPDSSTGKAFSSALACTPAVLFTDLVFLESANTLSPVPAA